MFSTATALLDATQKSLFDEDTMGLAGELHVKRNELDDEQFAKYLFMYSSFLASVVADRITKVLLTEAQMKELIDSIEEMEEMTETILEENE